MTRSEIDALLALYEPRLRDAFMRAVNETVDAIVLLRVVEALERRDIEAAVRAVGLDPAAFGPLQLAISEAYYAGGMGEAAGIRARDPDGNRVVFRFGVRNLEAEQWLQSSSSALVTRMDADQVIGLRTSFAAGLARGDNPRTTALDVIGRINRATQRREGGIIGLTSQQASYVDRARDNLLSGDPARMREYLTLTRRDKRHDRTVLKAIREGRALSRDEVTKITRRLSDSYLKLRGETIAHNETMQAMAKGRDDAIRQAVTAGKIDAETTTKTWWDAGDSRVRPTHKHGSLGGQKVPFDQPFISSSGARLMYPHDPAAPTSETLGCRCWCDYRPSAISRFLRQYRERQA
ncbi:head morphogenesis protein [Ancylobacter sp.]|uniref:head morphogenesis protein n=1 Tax=Ancylobacter sp. TaxID=1872567 RepID=UPI003D1142AA